MSYITFKFKEHPGDLLRNTDIVQLPNPDKNLEDFLIYFLHHYQSDERVCYLDNLCKLLNNEFFDDIEKESFIEINNVKTVEEIKEQINLVEIELKNEAYKNFYNLILNNKIELLENGKK